MIRWIYLIKYPEGVSIEEGERWYLGTHTQEAKQMAGSGLISYRTWKAIEAPFGAGSRSQEQLNEWQRMTELVFSDWDAFDRAVRHSTIEYTPPAYGPKGFVYQTIFIGAEPEYDLLAETPRID